MVLGMMMLLSFGCIGGDDEAGVPESGDSWAPENDSGEEPTGEAGNESGESGPECAPEAEGNESGPGGEEPSGDNGAAPEQQAEEGVVSLEEAQQIALSSPCVQEGSVLIENYTYNNFTHTWWFETEIEKPGCSPACVVDEETLTAQINWRCTGLIVD